MNVENKQKEPPASAPDTRGPINTGGAPKKKYVPPHLRGKQGPPAGPSVKDDSKNNSPKPAQQPNAGRPKSQKNNNVQSAPGSNRGGFNNKGPNMQRATSTESDGPPMGAPTDRYDPRNSPSTSYNSPSQRSPGGHGGNRFSKANLYDEDQGGRGFGGGGNNYGGGGGRRGGGGMRRTQSLPNDYGGGPRNYQPQRQSFGPGQMRRQRSAEYHGRRNSGRFGCRERSTEPNPKLEQELFGDPDVTMGINFDIYDTIPVEISGNQCPKPLDAFDAAAVCHEPLDGDTGKKLPQVLLDNLKLAGFRKPTPVQRYSFPAGLHGRDLMSCAQTGSGKTAAFLVPIIARLLATGVPDIIANNPPSSGYGRSRSRYQQYQCYSLVLSPTRELAQQIHKQARKFLYRTGMRSAVVYGGADIKEQFRELDKGAEVLVATPGRLVDFLDRGRMSLENCRMLCMDEADRMLDMGFEPQIRQIVERYDMPEKFDGRQTLMFSATFPREIQVLAQDFLNDYIFLAVGRVGSSTDLIDQKLQYVANNNKVDALMEVLPACTGLTLIFVATRREADRIEHILNQEGVEARSIHGDRSQWEREEALRDFRSGRCPVLVATDVAARGLDIPDVMWVINFDLPNQIDSYVHRIGRTGRCGNRGNALSFVNESNKPVMRDLLNTLQECSMDVPQWFVSMVNNLSYGGDRRGGKKKGKSGFGGRDVRRSKSYGGGNGRNGGGGGGFQRQRSFGGRNGGNDGGSPFPGRQQFGRQKSWQGPQISRSNTGASDAW